MQSLLPILVISLSASRLIYISKESSDTFLKVHRSYPSNLYREDNSKFTFFKFEPEFQKFKKLYQKSEIAKMKEELILHQQAKFQPILTTPTDPTHLGRLAGKRRKILLQLQIKAGSDRWFSVLQTVFGQNKILRRIQ